MIAKIQAIIEKKINYTKYLKKRGMVIGDQCEIYKTADFGSEPYLISIGNHVRVNDGVHFITHDGGTWVLRHFPQITDSDKIEIFGRITIGDNVHIATNAIIMPNVTIGNNCIIGCNSIVTKDIPNNSVAVGIPASVIETIDEYLEKNKKRFVYTKHMSRREKREYLESQFRTGATCSNEK